MMFGAVALFAGVMTLPVSAQDTEEAAASDTPAVPAALAGVNYVTKVRPKADAKVYYLLRSHSSCGICVNLAPEFVKLHKQMKGKGAEFVLLSGDVSDEKAAAWAAKEKMTYAVVSPDEAKSIPFSFDFGGQSAATLPFIVAVTPDGEKLGQANGPGAADFVKDWKKLVAEQKKKQKAAGAESADEDSEDEEEAEEEESAPTIPDMLKDVEYIGKVRPKKKASVYFFIRSHSACGPCKALVPQCIDLYKAMKGKGAEMIMLNCGGDLAAEKAWVESAGMTYPVITPETAGAVDVPSGGSGGTPNVVAVTAAGEMLEGTSGTSKCAALMGRWKEFVKDAKKQEKAEKKKAAAKKKSSDKKKKRSKKKKSETEESDEDI